MNTAAANLGLPVPILIPEDDRVQASVQAFPGEQSVFPYKIEPSIYNVAAKIGSNYTGGYWDFYRLPGGAFFMAPAADKEYRCVGFNGNSATLGRIQFGAAVCAITYSNLSFWAHDANRDNLCDALCRYHSELIDWCYHDYQPVSRDLFAILD